ncbi:hypothetical protein AOLI_G00040520 [Acnodon oligacanthus]
MIMDPLGGYHQQGSNLGRHLANSTVAAQLPGATYETLPCPRNLSQWFGSEEKCPLCSIVNVLRKLAEQLEGCRVRANNSSDPPRPNIPIVRPGDGVQKTVVGKHTCLLTPGCKWQMRADLGTQLVFPIEITQTTLRPDVVMWSTAAKKVLIIELTVPWEEGMSAAYKHKRLKYSDLAAECREGGWIATIHTVEVGCRGFVGKSTIQLLHATGMTGTSLKKSIK